MFYEMINGQAALSSFWPMVKVSPYYITTEKKFHGKIQRGPHSAKTPERFVEDSKHLGLHSQHLGDGGTKDHPQLDSSFHVGLG